MKPMLKPPKTKRLKPKTNELLSCFAFRFNFSRYAKAALEGKLLGALRVGSSTCPLLTST